MKIRSKERPKTILVSINGREEERGTITNDDDPNGTNIQRDSGVVTPYVSDLESEGELIYPEEEERHEGKMKELIPLPPPKAIPPPKTKQPVHLVSKKSHEKEVKVAGHSWSELSKKAKPIIKINSS